MNVQPGTLTAIGLVRNPQPGSTTAGTAFSPDISLGGSVGLSGGSSAKTDFISLADMRRQMLQDLGSDENSVKAMSAQDRKAIENKIREQMQAAIEDNAKGSYNPGWLADVKA